MSSVGGRSGCPELVDYAASKVRVISVVRSLAFALAPPPGESGPTQLEPAQSPARGPGLRAATPGRPGETEALGYSCGTSNSAALATRILSQLLDVLEGLQHNHDQFPFPDAQYQPVLAKTLLVHAARWHDAGPRLKDLLGPRQTRRELSRLPPALKRRRGPSREGPTALSRLRR